jgi:hypothetical protein
MRRIKRKRGRRTAQMQPKGPPRKGSRIKASKRSQRVALRDKVRAHRARMRARGFRLVQMWLPDTRTSEFATLAHRASLALANSPTEQDDQAFIDSVQWWTSEENAG